MSILYANTFNPGAGLTNPASAAETVAVQTGPIITGLAGRAPIHITGTLNITPAGSTTAVKVALRQGGLSGTLVGAGSAPTHTTGAGSPVSIPFSFTDNSGWASGPGQSYSLTVQQVGGSGAGTINLLDLKVDQ